MRDAVRSLEDSFDYETATFSASYLLARNLRFVAEFTHDLERETNRFVLGMVGGM